MPAPTQETQLFESLARSHPALKTWLEGELAKQTKVLMAAVEIDQLRRAQGAALHIRSVLDKLESAVNAQRR